jgi:uncharacterized protein YcbK (DUF882 family)
MHWKPCLNSITLLVLLVLSPAVLAETSTQAGRFFYTGNGHVKLYNPKNGQRQTIQYRLSDGSYPDEAMAQIDKVFSLKSGADIGHMSLRFIALLDYIQDTFGEGIKTLQLDSAYRAPAYNQGLRNQGRTVAKASTHMEGMAADITIPGVKGKFLWESLRDKNCCGVGWYGKDSVHVDTGPARWWTGATSKVKTTISDHNKKILVRTDFDMYQRGQTAELFVGRITEYPIGVKSELRLVRVSNSGEEKTLKKLSAEFSSVTDGTKQTCQLIKSREEARGIRWRLPKRMRSRSEKSLHIRVDVCEKSHPEMPDSFLSNRIEIR